MGTCASQNSSISAEHVYAVLSDSRDRCIWREQLSSNEALYKYFRIRPRDGLSIRPAHVEFRALLNDNFSMGYIGQYAKDILKHYLITCWNDIQIYKNLSPSIHATKEFTRITELVRSYQKIPGQNHIVDSTLKTKDESDSLTDQSTIAVGVASREAWEQLELVMFEVLYSHVFTPFLWTNAFSSMCRLMKQTYNCVTDSDFEYYEKICEGAYGLVMHVKKKSTNVHYAMKVQGKALLLHHLQQDPQRILQEMQTLASFDHPFIMPLLYAFQTDILAVMVMPLCVYGDLGILILNSPQRRIPLPDVMFYTAEILSALQYLHSFGIMYRDLKPGNVLLAGDGHCLLADFGAAIDTEGVIADDDLARSGIFRYYSALDAGETINGNSSLCEESAAWLKGDKNSLTQFSLDMFTNKEGASESTCERRAKKMRAKSIVGTVAYMAPEIIFKFGSRAVADQSYTNAIDYWSLGITVYTMIYGKLPFRHVRVEKLQQYLIQVMARPNANQKQIFDKVFGTVTYSGVNDLGGVSYDMSNDNTAALQMQENQAVVESFVGSLLQFDPTSRCSSALGGDIAALNGNSLQKKNQGRSKSHDNDGGHELKEDQDREKESMDKSTPRSQQSATLSDVSPGIMLGGPLDSDKKRNIRNHAFFKSIDWSLLDSKELKPPDIHPKIKALAAKKYEGKGLQNEDEFAGKPQSNHPPPKVVNTVYTMEDILVRNGRNKWLLGSDNSAPCAAFSASGKSQSGSSLYVGLVENFPEVEANHGAEHAAAFARSNDVDSGEFYQISAAHQQMFAHWYYVDPNIIELEQRHQADRRKQSKCIL